MAEEPFAAAVLTGGASRRMGRDKAAILIGGVTMAARVAEAARAAGASNIVGVGRAVAGVDHRADDHPGEGPLGGLLTALRWAGDRAVVVLGCDLVAPSSAAIRRAAAALARSPGHDVAVPVTGSREQWLHGCWAPSGTRGTLQTLDAAFAAGERSIRRAALELAVLRYEEPDAEAMADADLSDELPPGAR